jgi:pimeloyl-ACP methyl ester carboxylesterase
MIRPAAAPDTVVLIHGFWVTARSWEHWAEHYRARGLDVLTPTYPGLEVEVESLRADPTPIARLTVPAIREHLENVIERLERPPVLIGHSAGGTFVQLLVDRGYGAAGVVIDSAPPEGVRTTPVSQIRSVSPVLRNPANRHRAVAFTPKQFHYAFTNTLTAEESAEVYDRYAIAASGRILFDTVLNNFRPGHQDTWVDYRNSDRAPLLFIAGGQDHLMPTSVNAANAKRYRKSAAITDFHEFPDRSHYTLGEAGWQEVADYALDWALEHAGERPSMPTP